MKHPIDYEDRRARRDAWSDLSGDWMDDERNVSTVFWTGATIWIILALIFGSIFFVVGYRSGSVPEYVPKPGFEMCRGGC